MLKFNNNWILYFIFPEKLSDFQKLFPTYRPRINFTWLKFSFGIHQTFEGK